ncbi:MAG: L-aspartate oxidase [Planctomycetota bacterium]|nr:L-aspartate oxidase [Planctomycetota bacterium]
MSEIPRYLTAFDPKRLPHHFTDILIIGAGLAGLRAANAVTSKQEVLVITKDDLRQSNSNYAQGGIAGVLAPEDRFEDHVADTVLAGGELCHREIVEMVVREAPDQIQQLMQWGTRFDKDNGELELGREGGHSRHRVVHALGDATGKEVMRAVISWTRKLPNIRVWENTFTIDLLTHDGICRGALVATGQGMALVWAKQTILCTGGGGQLYRESTNPPVATADGHALAFRAGGELRDLEFLQFHPTVLYIAGTSRSLITEAIRGEGAYLIDRNGLRFMEKYDPRQELAPRDVVSQAIVSQMQQTQHPCVYLDLSHLDSQFVRSRFPGIAHTCEEFGIDVTQDPIPVRPGAHYMIGGVIIDDLGRTSVPGLWAAGEVTSSGLHGANRLASNSLLEGLVYGGRAGAGAAQAAATQSDDYRAPSIDHMKSLQPIEALDLADIRNSLQSLMWRSMGVRREAKGLEEARQTIEHWCRYVLVRQFDTQNGWELQNLLTIARLMVAAASCRQESRGVHLRTDFPTADNAQWKQHVSFRHTATPLLKSAVQSGQPQS